MDESGEFMSHRMKVCTSITAILLLGVTPTAWAGTGMQNGIGDIATQADDGGYSVGAKDGYGQRVIGADPNPAPDPNLPSPEEIEKQQQRYDWACQATVTPPSGGNPLLDVGAAAVNDLRDQARDTIGPGLDCDPQSQAASQTKVREALAHIPLPKGDFYLDPNPDNNEWHAAAVGQNLWFTIDLPERQHTIVTQDGITITLDAEAYNIRINLGDSSDTIFCNGSSKRPRGSGNKPSPSCGGAYSKTGTYTLTAEISWNITWTALDTTGTDTITQTATGTRTLEIIELETVLVPNDEPS